MRDNLRFKNMRIIAAILGILQTFFVGIHVAPLRTSPKVEISPKTTSTPTPSLTPTLTPTVTPTIQVYYPSKESLQVAAFLWIRLPSAQQTHIKSEYGGSSDTDTITNWAFAMDKNPAIYAQDEAVMQELQQAATNRGYLPYYQPQNQLHSCLSYSNGNWINTTCN